MKLKTFFFSLFLCSTIAAEAQLSIGAKVTRNQAWQYYANDFPELNNNLKVKGFGVAATFQFHLNDHLRIGAEPGYIQRGAACEPGFVGDNIFLVEDATQYARYIQLPLHIEGGIPIMKNAARVFGKCGFGAGYFVSGYRNISFWDGSPREDQAIIFDNEPNLRRLDYGLNGGAGLALNFLIGEIVLEGNYYHGLRDVDQRFSSKYRDWSLSLGYRMVFGNK